ncbi:MULTISPECIES: HAD-IIB family hydrolase [Cyanophyceae]|uniref:HAD-IIB family hydrolase n=1 Tax=Cyanophyceae TaxID=3028117 RepID=UPI00232EC1AF|nr:MULTISPECIES: HAD-IIB family hydrolase [Cyanophyceae]MDB9323069.1 HAD-IIB family hydrolase [Nodularia spumigena CS-591/07A]MDB9333329.1 HAD-IIB family hydrolase [Nodularia spumigena CS-591/04]MDB9337690.1 HAD-IIB family hydrolase [Nodularia spumigena CS-589/07]MDB9362298.1 HAD-IIB family hydrolase [Nodularia spumigena CS-588/02]MDB9363411.1 HAD-IIB family hydrolase [Nodularia spumigena CS-588/02A10]
MSNSPGLYILLVSVHGLIRGKNLELGRDADTGGQIKYAVELAQALAANPQVERVDLVTRLVNDPKVSSDYAQPVEVLSDKAQIIRVNCGPRRYLRKEVLWPHLDNFADELLKHLRQVGKLPHIIHSHYADAGYVGCRVAGWLGVPLVHTGHSLGRVKQQRLLEHGTKKETIESTYHISTRIEAEEATLASAALVIASTHQEVTQQYGIYDHYQPKRMVVIPPGVALKEFYPVPENWQEPPIYQDLKRFLNNPEKPMIMALSRPAIRKNVATLVKAYGEDPELRHLANLVLILGNRDDITTMESGPRHVLTEIFQLIDRYDLYGYVAYPKHHRSDEVADLYRLLAKTRGVFINPALTEPFGLTLIEATACGVPIIATSDGGPRDILDACENGMLIDPLDIKQIQDGLRTALTNREQWETWSKNGLDRVRDNFSWSSHVERYLEQVKQLPQRRVKSVLSPLAKALATDLPDWNIPDQNRLPTADRFLVCEIDNTLLGDQEALHKLIERLHNEGQSTGVGIATGRNLESSLQMLEEWHFPRPDLLIVSAGSEIYYGPQVVPDSNWQRHISYHWNAEAIRQAMEELPGVGLQPPEAQGKFKLSYFIDEAKSLSFKEIMRHLRRRRLHVKGIYSHNMYLDLLPIRASKGDAIRYCALKWGLPIKRFLVAGASGNDESMLSGNTLGVVVGNYSAELEKLHGYPQIYFAEGHYAWGILEALDRYDFFGTLSHTEPEMTAV